MADIVTYKKEEDELTCIFSGRLDSVISEMIEDDVFNHVQIANCPVVFDFKNVEYVSSAFLRVSIKAARAVPSMKVDIINSLPDIKEVYEMTGLGKIFTFK
jgi:anti-sigma B factor antagonist